MTDLAPQPASLLDWATGLVTDPAARAGFAADPRGTLDRQGLTDVDPADLHHAMSLVADTVAARVDTVVDGSSASPALLDGESRVDALVRQFRSFSEAVTPSDDVPHPWSDTEVDDLDGSSPVPGDHDLDDQVPHDPFHAGHVDVLDHGLDAMSRPESHAPVATVSFLPSAPQRSAAPPTPEAAPHPADGFQDHEGLDPGHHEPEQHEDHGPDQEHHEHEHHDLGHHEVEQHHDLDVHDLDAAP